MRAVSIQNKKILKVLSSDDGKVPPASSYEEFARIRAERAGKEARDSELADSAKKAPAGPTQKQTPPVHPRNDRQDSGR